MITTISITVVVVICKGDGWWCRLSQFLALVPRTNCFLTPLLYIHKMVLLRGEFCLEHRIHDGSQTRHNERRQIFLSCCTNYGYQRLTRLKWALKLTFEARINRDLKLECTCFVRKYSAVGLLGLRGCCILDDCLYGF